MTAVSLHKDPGTQSCGRLMSSRAMSGCGWSCSPSPRSPGAVTAPCPSQAPPLFGLICLPACLIMVVEMLISFNVYSGRERHHRTAA
jgi:hypothetical protein